MALRLTPALPSAQDTLPGLSPPELLWEVFSDACFAVFRDPVLPAPMRLHPVLILMRCPVLLLTR